MKVFTVIIVEDDSDVRQRLVDLVSEETAFNLLGDFATMETGLEALFALKPDVLLTDLGLPDGSGIDIIKAISKRQLDTLAMVISGFQDEHIVFKALEAGASGYLLKYNEGHSIIESIKSMLDGGAPISPVIARLMLQRFKMPSPHVTDMDESLTERQIKILKFVSQGFSSKEIAQKLDISYYTVTTHIKNIYNKLQVNSRTEALHEAAKQGLIQ